MNTVLINKSLWFIKYVNANSEFLKRSDGSRTLGVTDYNTHTIYICRNLNNFMKDKVVCHELCHAFCLSYGILLDIRTEEIVADFLATYGRNVFYVADEILGRFAKIA